MPSLNRRAAMILSDFEAARMELVGKAAVLSDGKAGTIEAIWLDDFHGLRVSIKGHIGKWPISTVKFLEEKLRED
jgi:hypothetical protein